MHYASNSVFIEQTPFSHDVEGYASYLNSFNNNNRSTRLQNARRFARFYPDLAEWQRGSLIDRIGSYQARRGTLVISPVV